MDPKVEALAKFLSVKPEDVSEVYGNDREYYIGRENYMVLTDSEADDAAADYIKDSLWAFRAGFICAEAGLPSDAERMIEKFQAEACENANDTIKALIRDLPAFIKSAIQADGRGHFLSSYDGEEYEETINGETYYIYRTN